MPRAGLRPAAQQRGFTLIEMIMVMVILGIAAAIVLPSLREAANNSRARSQAADALGDLQFARSEALSHGEPIAICPSTDAANCSGNWTDGWIIFVDDGATVGSIDAGESVLRVREDKGASAVTVMNDDPTPVALSFLRFDRRGQSNRATVLICAAPPDIRYARAVLIENSGRVMHSRRGGSGVHVDAAGNDVAC